MYTFWMPLGIIQRQSIRKSLFRFNESSIVKGISSIVKQFLLFSLVAVTSGLVGSQGTGSWVYAADSSIVAEKYAISDSDEDYRQALRSLSASNYSEAQRLLERITAKTPTHAGAWLDLAILHCQLGQAQRAELIYQKIERELNPPEGILELIRQLRAQPCEFQLRWVRQAHLALGHSSNVNFAPVDGVIRFASNAPFQELVLDNSFRPRGDLFGLAELQSILPANRDNLWSAQWHTVLQYRKHAEVTDYDTLLLGLGARWSGYLSHDTYSQALRRIGLGAWESSAQIVHMALGGRPYENSLAATTALWSQDYRDWLDSSRRWRWGLEFLASGYQYPDNQRYNALRIDLRLRQQWQATWKNRLFLFGLMAGKAKDHDHHDRPGGQRNGWVGRADLEARWSNQQQSVVNLQQIRMKESEAYNQAFFGPISRLPHMEIYTLKHSYWFSAKDSVYVQYSYQQAKDTISLFSYKNQTLLFGYQWLY